MITSKECINAIKQALKQFGEHSYYDKRSYEVIDMDDIKQRMQEMSGKEIADVLVEVLAYEHGEVFVSDVLSMLEDRADLNELYADPRLQEYS